MFSLCGIPGLRMKLMKLGFIILGEGPARNGILIGAVGLVRRGLNVGVG